MASLHTSHTSARHQNFGNIGGCHHRIRVIWVGGLLHLFVEQDGRALTLHEALHTHHYVKQICL